MISRRFSTPLVSVPLTYGRIITGRLYNHWSFRAYGDDMRSLNTTVSSSTSRAIGGYFLIPERMTIDRTALYVSTAVAGQTAKIGWYEFDDDGIPQDLIFETAEIDCASTGTKLATVSHTFAQGLYIPVVSASSGSIAFQSIDYGSGGDAGISFIGNTFLSQTPIFGAKFLHTAGSPGSMTAFPANAASAFDTYLDTATETAAVIAIRIA